MGKDYGEPLHHDPTFNGPIHNRSCTDILFLIAFILSLGVWGFVGFYGMQHGSLEKLLAPMDSQGKRCGLDFGLENKKYLVFFDILKCLSPGTPITGCPTPQACVKKCPTETIIFTRENFIQHRSKMVCLNGINAETMTWEDAETKINDNNCTRYIIQSQPVLGGRCFANVTELLEVSVKIGQQLLNETDAVSEINSLLNFNQLSAQIVQDLVQSRWYLLGALVAVVVICFAYILLLRWVVAPVVWASIAALFALLGYSMYLCYINYAYYKANPVTLIKTTNVKGYLEAWFTKHEVWMALLIAVAIIFLILLLIVIFLRGRIVIAIALIREGSKAVYAVKSTVFFPIFPWIVQCFVIVYGVIVLMYLLSMGESLFKVVDLKDDPNCSCIYKDGKHGIEWSDSQQLCCRNTVRLRQLIFSLMDGDTCDLATFALNCHDAAAGICTKATCHFTGLDSPTSVVWLHLANLLFFFWTMCFVSGVADMMLASTFSTWYWTFHKSDMPFFTLTAGIYRTVRYHLGTVAFGSLIIAIVQVIRVILEYIDHKLKKFDNPVTRCLMCFCKCCFWCLESFLKFINKNAFIMCAVHGKNFCTSARDAFSLLMRNILRVVVLDKVTDFIFFLSKVLISLGVGLAVYFILQVNLVYEITNGEQLHYNFIPAIILSVATYFICTIFFNVYAMAVDTLFLCFLEDCERNDGSPEKPYFMSKNLMKILGKKNKKA